MVTQDLQEACSQPRKKNHVAEDADGGMMDVLA